MQNIQIENRKNKIILTINKKEMDQDYLIRLIKRLETEDLAYKSGINEQSLQIAEDIKQEWWNENKSDFLKDIKK